MVIELTKYLMILMVGAYTYHAFRASVKKNKVSRDISYRWMTWFLFMLHFTGYFTMYIQLKNTKLLLLYAGEALVFLLVLFAYKFIYPGLSGLLLRNMLMLLSIGYIILTRLSFDKAVRQFYISAVALGIGLLVPMLFQRFAKIRNYGWIYGIVGVFLLVLVLLIGTENFGATSWITVFGLFTIHPTEFVKPLFVFCVASLFSKGADIKRVCAVTAIAGATVLSLVLQKDLGAALIFFVTYIFMLYGATKKPLYLIIGLWGGTVASWVAYKLFDHVKVRVMAWRNPFGYIDKEGYQISQSLFAMGTGGWFGMGLYQGLPTTIPVVDSDFIFSAISEELGGLFALCLILLYINCFIIIINVSLKTKDSFYRLLSLGFAVMLGFQVFLSIGGVIKFIPSTGVTLPFISSGGSSIVATIVMFMVMQGIYSEGKMPLLAGENHDKQVEQ
ncbi:MAG: FtsW/RodA/SpoVE family cell cycle protein [Clostridiales bacterium]|nr:FtsW/RodA/SpoVE family cell cycle protein [Clostridiales bacterium]